MGMSGTLDVAQDDGLTEGQRSTGGECGCWEIGINNEGRKNRVVGFDGTRQTKLTVLSGRQADPDFGFIEFSRGLVEIAQRCVVSAETFLEDFGGVGYDG